MLTRGTSITRVVPESALESMRRRPSRSAIRSLIPRQAECRPGPAPRRVEPDAVVLYDRSDRTVRTADQYGHLLGLRVLQDVGERLLHDAVEGGLELAPQALVGKLGAELHGDPGLLREGLRKTLERGREPEGVERLRAQLDGESADVVDRADDQLAHVLERARPVLVALGVLDRLQAEQDRG